jgi:hypothetical protein
MALLFPSVPIRDYPNIATHTSSMYVLNQSGPISKVGAAIVSSNCNIVEHNLQG